MSIWHCKEHGIQGPSKWNVCPTCGAGMTRAEVQPMIAASRPPDDTQRQRYTCGCEVNYHGGDRAAMVCPTHSKPVAPDDTPTRLPEDELERERMRLAACMSAALGNTPSTAAERIGRDHPYWSASYGCVCDAVDREMALRAEVSRLREERDSWQRLANQSSAKHCSVAEQLGDLTDERDDLKVEVSRLQQENALLRRSLEMLTKQLDEKDERIDELVGLIGEVD